MRQVRVALCLAVLAALTTIGIDAVTPLPSADGQFWDVQDTSPWAQDSGGIATGGSANPFDGFGYLKVEVRQADASELVANRYLHGFGLSHDGIERFDSITPLLQGGIVVSRSLFAPKETDYLRYFDTYTNGTTEERRVDVAWGGAAGDYEDGGLVAVATTSSGDRRIDPSDTFVTVMQNATRVDDPMRGPSGHGPSAHVLGSKPGLLVSAGDMYANPFTDPYPGFDPAHVGYVYRVSVPPGQTVGLMTFVVKGLSEVYDPRGGFPVPLKDAMVAPYFNPPYSGPSPKIPAAGSEIARVTEIARRLVASPDLRGLTSRQRAQIANWNLTPATPLPAFTVFEKTAPQLQDAMTRGDVASEDIVREYLARLSLYDRNGPTFRAMLALNPRAVADARALDAERSSGRVRGPLHGVPVAFKDNIDALGLPTTGGSLAMVDHRPRLDSRVAAGMRRAGAVILGKTNLDEFPFGDFGISSVAGTVGNAFDPTMSTAGSSGGSAVATSTSLVAFAFGTDTCNSLSNPASFASLATIRTTRGMTSRAGVMPLNTYQDAVGPITKSVRELALVLDEVTGPDAEDAATTDAASHIPGSFVTALDPASLKGARLGLLRQRFVGFSGEREAATLMGRVVNEVQAAGATVVEVRISDLDARYEAARGSAPGSLKAGWTAYLSRGAGPGDPVLTIDDLLATGKLAPVSAARFRAALSPIPTGEDLRQATEKFYAGRDTFRQAFVDLMEQQHLDALLYPANQARPHTHEGGLIRYDMEPGTCAESAMTGLPQVTVPAGFLGERYPFGISFLGRLWDDRRVLGLAYAYEQATQHRRPPDTVR